MGKEKKVKIVKIVKKEKVKKIKHDKHECKCVIPCTECKCQDKDKDKVKGKRGRPKKVKVEREGEGIEKEVKGRGRPKKEYKQSKWAEMKDRARNDLGELIPLVPTRTYKSLGFCPSCLLSIADIDLDGEKEGYYKCPKCDSKGKIETLKVESGLEKAKTKKEYLQSVNSVYTWHNYNASSNINTIAKPEDLVDEVISETSEVKSDEEDMLSQTDHIVDNDKE